ncbi:hypothetical protein GN956_G15189 [Arapaima gigas]
MKAREWRTVGVRAAVTRHLLHTIAASSSPPSRSPSPSIRTGVPRPAVPAQVQAKHQNHQVACLQSSAAGPNPEHSRLPIRTKHLLDESSHPMVGSNMSHLVERDAFTLRSSP